MTHQPKTTSDYRRDRLRQALRGAKRAIRDGSTLFFHLFLSAMLVAAGWTLAFDAFDWIVLLLCIVAVFAAEFFNIALQRLAQAVDPGHNAPLEQAQEISQAAVLVVALGALAALTLVFAVRIAVFFGG